MIEEKKEEEFREERCAQCRNKNPEKGFIKKIIHHRLTDNYGVMRLKETPMTVCAETDCGTHLQWSYEG